MSETGGIPKSARVGHLLDVAGCFIWGGLCVGLFFGGVLILLQRPVFTYFTLGAGVCLLFVGYLKFIRGPVCPEHGPACAVHTHAASGMSWRALVARITILILPLLFGLLVQGKGLNALAAMQRGVDFDAQDLIARLHAERELNLEMGVEYPQADISQIYQLVKRKRLKMKLRTTAFVVKVDDVPEGHMIIVRFLIWCCSADAKPLPVMIACENPGQYKHDAWVMVYGVLTERDFKGKPVPCIIADRVRILEGDEIPAKPYLY